MRLVVLGLSITSAWGNGHASTYRSLLAALARRGHEIVFLERDVPWYAEHRELTRLPYARIALYRSLAELDGRHAGAIRDADLVIVGSYVPDGPDVIDRVLARARGARAFYDIDTPVTMAMLEGSGDAYIRPDQIPAFDLYLSFSGGPVLEALERRFGARRARPLYCSVDPDVYRPERVKVRWHLGYLGTYSADRARGLQTRLVAPACRWREGRFVVAGAQFPTRTAWPPNVDRMEHVPPSRHGRFYGAQRYTLNLTRRAMRQSGHSPSIRLFEAAACGVPIISDPWPGLNEFFTPGEEIFVSRSTRETLDVLVDVPESTRRAVAARARARVLAAHTAAHRAAELESYMGGA